MILRAALRNEPVRLTLGQQYRDFCCVQDIARVVAATLHRRPTEGEAERFFGRGREADNCLAKLLVAKLFKLDGEIAVR